MIGFGCTHQLHYQHLQKLSIVVLIFLLTVATGCSDSSELRGRVHGKVTVDGKPLPTAQIRFFSVSGGVGTDGTVKDGSYEIPIASGMTSGKYRVELSFAKSTGRKIPDPDAGAGDMKDEVVEDLPAKFNRNSTIQIDFDPKQDKPIDLDLKR